MVDEVENGGRPLALNLMAGLYLFFFLVSASTFGNPFPFLGYLYQGAAAKVLVFGDSLACLYLFLGVMKRQALTWYLLLGYNLFEIINTMVNVKFIPVPELERVLGNRIDYEAMVFNNIAAALALLLLSQFIYRHKQHFSNHGRYLF